MCKSLYNREIVEKLATLTADKKNELNHIFGPSFVQNAIDGYTLIAQAQEQRELLVYKFIAYKS